MQAEDVLFAPIYVLCFAQVVSAATAIAEGSVARTIHDTHAVPQDGLDTDYVVVVVTVRILFRISVLLKVGSDVYTVILWKSNPPMDFAIPALVYEELRFANSASIMLRGDHATAWTGLLFR